jgi:hypothetical protein
LQALAALLSINRCAFVSCVTSCSIHGILRILTPGSQSSAIREDEAVKRSSKMSSRTELFHASILHSVLTLARARVVNPSRHRQPSRKVGTARETTVSEALCCGVRQVRQICKTMIRQILCSERRIASAQRTIHCSIHVL